MSALQAAREVRDQARLVLAHYRTYDPTEDNAVTKDARTALTIAERALHAARVADIAPNREQVAQVADDAAQAHLEAQGITRADSPGARRYYDDVRFDYEEALLVALTDPPPNVRDYDAQHYQHLVQDAMADTTDP